MPPELSTERGARRRRTLLVCSGGGHLKQLLLLRSRFVPSVEPIVWFTFDTPLSRSLPPEDKVVMAHYGAPRDVTAILRNARVARRLLRDENIGRVVSTGAHPALSVFPLARARGLPCHFIESATRSQAPSATGSVLRWLPGTHLYTQHRHLAVGRWRYGGSVFEGFRPEPAVRRGPIRRVVVTVGTSDSYGFRRLLEKMVSIVPPGAEVLWQTGSTDVSGLTSIDARASVPGDELEAAMRDADVVVAHAGTGSALSSLQAGKCPVLVYRDAGRGEHIDDHQLQTATTLASAGLAVATSVDGLDGSSLEAAAEVQITTGGLAPPFLLVED